MKSPDLTIVIPTRNRPEILARTLSELKDGGFGDWPLLIYDDASDDSEAVAGVLRTWPNVKLLKGEVRAGQACGRNRLLKAVNSEYALFLDDDCWPENKIPLLKAFVEMKSEGYGVASFQYRSLSTGRLDFEDRPRERIATSFLGGGCIFHAEKILEIGGYRESFVYGYEEPELAMRLNLAGITIGCFPEVILSHNQFYGAGEARDLKEYDRLYARNGILMSSLNLPLPLGLLHGLARSVRRSMYHKRNFGSKLLGSLQGVFDTLRLWSTRQPCSWEQARAYLRNRE